MKKTSSALAILCLLAAPLAAQVTKEDIRKLTVVGISDNVILKYIQANGPVLPMTADDLADLKRAGASDRVLAVLAQGSGGSVDPGTSLPAPETEVPAAPPQASYVDYGLSAYTPLYSYYSAPPQGYCPGPDTYYYSPWFDYYYPSCAATAGFCTPGFSTSVCFGFPSYDCCFYPWYGGCFASFGWGHRSFNTCYRPFGFCARPFGSFFPGTPAFHGRLEGVPAIRPRSSSFFTASGPAIEGFRESIHRTVTAPRSFSPPAGFSRAGTPWSGPMPPRPSSDPTPRVWRGWSPAPSHPFSSGTPRAYAPYSWGGHASTPHSSSSGSSGSWGHGGGSSHGSSGGGGGHGGGHGGGGHR